MTNWSLKLEKWWVIPTCEYGKDTALGNQVTLESISPETVELTLMGTKSDTRKLVIVNFAPLGPVGVFKRQLFGLVSRC